MDRSLFNYLCQVMWRIPLLYEVLLRSIIAFGYHFGSILCRTWHMAKGLRWKRLSVRLLLETILLTFLLSKLSCSQCNLVKNVIFYCKFVFIIHLFLPNFEWQWRVYFLLSFPSEDLRKTVEQSGNCLWLALVVFYLKT